MSMPLPCPESSLLDAILRGRVSPDDEIEIERHLEVCEQCRKAVDVLAGAEDSDLLTEFSTGEPEPIPPQLQNAIEQLKDDAAVSSDEPEEFILRISSPTDFEGSLGTVGEYEIMGRIGKGGMGVVYRGFDPKLNRSVALKFLASRFAQDPGFRERFIREARAAANINHPNVITVHNISEVQGIPYIVMEFVDGESLQQRLRRMGPLPLTMVARIGLQVAEGLAAAHDKQVIHRDIKPSNILLCGDNDAVRITDFGLAQASGDPRLTQTGQLLGTPKFMSPEQARGENCDLRSDLFSLGSVLFAMSTGVAPISTSNRGEIISRVAKGEVDSIDDVDSTLPAWLRSTIKRLHKSEPTNRFANAHETATALRGRLDLADNIEISTADFWDGATLCEDELDERQSITGATSQNGAAAEQQHSLQTQIDSPQPVDAIDARPTEGNRSTNQAGSKRRRSQAAVGPIRIIATGPNNDADSNLRNLKRDRQILAGVIVILLACLIPIAWSYLSTSPAPAVATVSNPEFDDTSSPPIPLGHGPFVLVRDGNIQQRYDLLSDVLQAAQDGDIVELFGAAEITLHEKIAITNDIKVRAGFDDKLNRSCVPRIVTRSKSVLEGGMITIESDVVFEGIQFEGRPDFPYSGDIHPKAKKQALLQCQNHGKLRLVNCRLSLGPGNHEQHAIHGDLCSLDLLNCEILGAGIRWVCLESQSIRIENTVILANVGMTLFQRPAKAKGRPVVKLKDCTIISDKCFAVFMTGFKQPVNRLHVETTNCAFKGKSSLFQLRQMPSVVQFDAAQLANIIPVQFVAWKGNANVYDLPSSVLSIADRGVQFIRARDVGAWNALWKNQDSNAIDGRVKYNTSRGLPSEANLVAKTIYELRIDVEKSDGSIPPAGIFLSKMGPGFGYDDWVMNKSPLGKTRIPK